MKHRFQIKILNGPLAGRRLRLPEGEFAIGGKDPDLDAMLEGGAVAVLNSGEEGVRLTTEAPCWLEGKPWDPGEQPVPMGSVMDVGGLALIVGGADEALPDRAVPRRQDERPAQWPGMLAGGCLILLLAGSAGAAIWAYAALQRAEAVVDESDWLDDWKRRARQQGIEGQHLQDGTFRLDGVCLASADRTTLIEQLRHAGVNYRDDTLCQDELLRNVQAVLALNGFADARVRAGETLGSVVIQGSVQADGRWRHAVGMLATMRGLREWRLEDPVGQGVKQLIGLLRDAGLIGKVSVARERNLILITGVLDDGAQRALASVTQLFAHRFPDAPKLIFQNIPTRAIQSGLFPSPVVSFGGSGELAFIDLANGTRLKAGSRLPAGHVIVHLDRNGIDLEREGELMHLPLEL